LVARLFVCGLAVGVLTLTCGGLLLPAAGHAATATASVSASQQRAGARKAVPVTRGQELGLRFRPDERESPYGQMLVPPAGAETYSPELQSQFRPAPKRRKPSYEELQAEGLTPQPALTPLMPPPMVLPPPMPGVGAGWPNW